MDRNKIEQNHTVYYYNVDQFHNLTMSSLVNYYTEIALAHTIKAGISFKYLNERNLYWVLYKMRIKVSRYPKLYEKIRIGTEGYNLIKFNAYRKYRMIDESGIVISEAEGIFMLLDSVKMRPAKMPDEMYDGYGVARGNNSRLEIDSLKSPENNSFIKEFTVNYNDLDINNHAGNVKYADWALETIPYEIRANHMLTDLTINYHKELKHNDSVVSVCQRQKDDGENLVFDHGIIDPREDKTAALLKSVWKKR